MLTKDPAQRISAKDVLAHPWMQSKTKDKNVDESVNTSEVVAVASTEVVSATEVV